MATRFEKRQAMDAALLKAAMDVFAQKGFEAATIAEIAKQAGMAVGTVYLRYPGKAELLAGVLDWVEGRFIERMQEAIEGGGKWPQRFERMYAGLMQVAEEVQELGVLMQLSMHASLGGRPRGSRIEAWIAGVIRQGQQEKAFEEMDAGLAAAMAFGMVEGALGWHMQRGGRDRGEVVKMLSEATGRWVLKSMSKLGE